MSTLTAPGMRYSQELLEDETNIRLLRSLVSGECVSVNINALSRSLHRHRNTVRKDVLWLLENKVVTRPICPFMGLYREYPLLVIVRADIPDEKPIQDWIIEDPHIFAAYWQRYAEYNTLLFVYHRDVLGYQLWRESLVEENKLASRGSRIPSDSMYVSNQLIVKYSPSAAIGLMEAELSETGKIDINGVEVDKDQFGILKQMTSSRVFKINENFLSEKIGIHRKTVTRRVAQLIKEQWILEPTCRFPDLLCPPNYVLVYARADIIKAQDRIRQALQADPHVSIALRVSVGGYNAIIFSAHPDISEHMNWEKELSKRFPGCVGRMDVSYLSPRNKITIDQQYVSLCILDSKLARLRGRKFREIGKASALARQA
jgi:hypothetical protein